MDLESVTLQPAELHGFRRVWGLVEDVYSDSLQREIKAVFLDLVPQQASAINGVLIPVSEKQLERIKLREKNYDVIDVTDRIYLAGRVERLEGGSIVTFQGKPEFRLDQVRGEAKIMENYESLVAAGCADLGELFTRTFSATTELSLLDRVSGTYRFLDSAQLSSV